MANKKAGRKPLPKGQKAKVMQAYLRDDEQKLIKNRFGNLTKAAREAVLPKCV